MSEQKQKIEVGKGKKRNANWLTVTINPDKIKEALGVNKIEELAAQAKMKASEVPQALSNLLPQIIDKLTPDGKEPENGIAAAAVKLLKGIQSRTGTSA